MQTVFKECKNYLLLGTSQNTDFDVPITDVTIRLAPIAKKVQFLGNDGLIVS